MFTFNVITNVNLKYSFTQQLFFVVVTVYIIKNLILLGTDVCKV